MITSLHKTCGGPRLWLWFSALALALCVKTVAIAGEATPPETLWHFFPSNVTNAFIGRDGRVFHSIRGQATATPNVSEGRVLSPGWLPVAHAWGTHLVCTREDTPKLFAAPTGEGSGKLLEIAPAQGTRFQAIDDISGSLSLTVSTWEGRSGRLWIGNTRGVQWLDANGQAGEHVLLAPNALTVGLPMTRLHFEEDAAGRMYFWALPLGNMVAGTVGFWSFDRRKWEQFTSGQGLPEEAIHAILPIDDETVWVNTQGGKLIRFRTVQTDGAEAVAKLVPQLNSPEWKERQAATQELIRLGRPAELPLRQEFAKAKEPEVRSRLKMVLDSLKRLGEGPQVLPGGRYRCDTVAVHPRRADRRNRPVWLATAQEVTDLETGKQFDRMTFLLTPASATPIPDWPKVTTPTHSSLLAASERSAWLGADGLGLFHWDGEATRRVTDAATVAYRRILGVDRHGRVLLNNGLHIAAYWPGKPEQRRRLASRSWPLGIYGVWGLASDGRVWAKLAERDEPLSVYAQGRWADLPGVRGSGPSLIIPGRDGAVFVNMAGPRGRFYLFRGDEKYEAADLAELAAKHPAAVRAAVDPSVVARSAHYAVTLDARDRLWVVNVRQLLMWPTEQGERVDVGATLPRPEAAFPWMALFARYDNGRTLLFARVPGQAWHLQCGGPKWQAAPCPKPAAALNLLERRVVDRAGRFWHGTPGNRAYRHTGTRVEAVQAEGTPVLADASGSVWLCRPGIGYHVVDGATDQVVTVALPAVDERTPLCERKPGEVWVACRDGLRRLRKADGKIDEVAVFRRDIPTAGATGLEADSDGTLWLATSSSDHYVLTAISVPENGDEAEKQPEGE